MNLAFVYPVTYPDAPRLYQITHPTPMLVSPYISTHSNS